MIEWARVEGKGTSIGKRTPGAVVRDWDIGLVRRSAELRSSRADAVLRALTDAADHSKIWMVTGAALTAVGGPSRRGGVRGILSLAVASVVANAVLKPLFPRTRPGVASMPLLRRVVSPPVSSSFPSGHSASAAAFATGVALESPLAGAIVAPLAAAVCYSRVHTGVHWPSDVLAGAALGTAIALSTRRWWAVRTEEPAELGSPVDAAALHEGRGLLVLCNPSSGSNNVTGPAALFTTAPIDRIRQLLPQAEVFEPDGDRDFGVQLEERIVEMSPAALGVCGGDGTVVNVAESAVRHSLPLAVFPGGTLNHFARDAGVADIDAVAEAVQNGQAARVDLASVTMDEADPQSFVNTATFGGYPDSVRIREHLENRIGKWPAAAIAMFRVLAAAEPLRIAVDGRPMSVWMLFVGNGRYHPTDQVPMSRSSIDSGTLDVRYLPSSPRLSRTRLLLATVTGTLGGSPTYVHRDVHTLDVDVDGSAVALATDGELVGDGVHFSFSSTPNGLTLYRVR